MSRNGITFFLGMYCIVGRSIMKKTFLRMIILLFLITTVGGFLCIWGQSLFVSNIENALFNRDMAYIDQVFYRLDIILALVNG